MPGHRAADAHRTKLASPAESNTANWPVRASTAITLRAQESQTGRQPGLEHLPPVGLRHGGHGQRPQQPADEVPADPGGGLGNRRLLACSKWTALGSEGGAGYLAAAVTAPGAGP